MRTYIKPMIFVITMDETQLLAGSTPKKLYKVGFQNGKGDDGSGASGEIMTLGKGEDGNGSIFSKQYTPSFDDTTDPEW